MIMSGANLVNIIDPTTSSEFPLLSHNARIGSVLNQSQNPNPVLSTSAGNNLLPGVFQHQQPPPPIEATREKPQIFNPQMIMNQNQAHFGQNLSMFLPLTYAQL